MAFDVDGARRAGYSEAEIADHLAQQSRFDATKARGAGYSDAEIIRHLGGAAPAPAPAPAATPASPAPPAAAPKPTDGMSGFQKFTAGAGKAVVDTGRGLGQIVRTVVGDRAGDALGLPTQADIDEASRLDKPLMDTGAGFAGNVAGQVVQLAVPGAAAGRVGGLVNAGKAVAAVAPRAAAVVANPLVRAAATGGLFAATQPVVTGDTRAGNAAVGAAAGTGGQAVGSALSAGARGASSLITPQIKLLVARAEAAGIPVNIAQLSDSKFLKTLQSTLERLPFTGAQVSRDAQQQAFNRAVTRTFGEDAPHVTDGVYTRAKTRIGQEFERLSGQNNLDLNRGNTVDNLIDLADEVKRLGTSDSAKAVSNAIDELFSKADAGGIVPGKAYQALDSQLGRLTKGGNEKAMWLGRVRNEVRDAMDANIWPQDRKAWDAAREQYGNLKTVRDLVAKDAAEGNVSPSLLRGRVTANNTGKEAMASGRAGELGNLATIGHRFVRDPVPDSGTAQRALINGLLFGAGGAGAYVDPQSTALSVLTAATLGRGTNAAMNSRALREYLLKGIQTPVARAFLERSGAAVPKLFPATANALDW